MKYFKISVCGPLVGYLKEVALIKGNSAEFTLLMVHKHRTTPDRDLKRLKVDAWAVMSRELEAGWKLETKEGKLGRLGSSSAAFSSIALPSDLSGFTPTMVGSKAGKVSNQKSFFLWLI